MNLADSEVSTSSLALREKNVLRIKEAVVRNRKIRKESYSLVNLVNKY